MKIPTKDSGSILFSIKIEWQFQDVTHSMSLPDLSIPVILIFYNLKQMNLHRPIAPHLQQDPSTILDLICTFSLVSS